jgi:hypothetical protein
VTASKTLPTRPFRSSEVDLRDARNQRNATVSDPATWFGAGRSRRLCVRHFDGFRSVFLPSHEPGFADGLPPCPEDRDGSHRRVLAALMYLLKLWR